MSHLNCLCASQYSDSYNCKVGCHCQLQPVRRSKEKGDVFLKTSSSVDYAVLDAERSGSHGQ